MRRNLSNELIVALLAAASILFAAAFAVLLSTSTSQRPTVEPTEPTMQAATAAATTTQTSPPTTVATISVTPEPPEASATSTPVDAITEIAPANLTLTAIRETVIARREQAVASPSPTATERVSAATATTLPATEAFASVTPQPPIASATSTPEEQIADVAPANLTLTAIRETVVARRELAAARPSPTAAESVSAATALPATEAIARVTPQLPEASATATPLEEETEVAPANLTLTAIRETVVARREQATARPSPTAAELFPAATATALPATETFARITPQPPVASATSTPVKEPPEVAPANLTLTAIRETVVARREQAATRSSPTAAELFPAATATALPATEAFASVTPGLPETSATSTPEEQIADVAPANLTQTAIRETVVARRELATTLPSPTSDESVRAATATALPGTEAFARVTPDLPETSVTSTPLKVPAQIAPANLTLTAIRATVVTRREQATVRPSPTSDESVRAATATALPATGSIARVTPQPPEASATSTPVEEPTEVAPANLTQTAIRETVVARREQATVRPSPTSDESVRAATATALPATGSIARVTPQPPEASATSTPVEEPTEVAPANLTQTAIREAVVARREQATVRPSPTSDESVRAATATALPATEAIARVTPQAPEASATSTQEEEIADVAPANLTLTAIRETVVARRELATTLPSPTTDEPVRAATALPATETFASVTPDLPETSATSTPVEEPAQIAPANLKLTAIRETVVARRELATTLPSPTTDEPVRAATALPATEAIARVTPQAPEASATSTQEEEIADVAPANLTLTAIRETVVARRELATTLPSPTATERVSAATSTALPATEAFASVTPQPPVTSATSTPVEEETSIEPANLALTAIRETVVARRELAATRPSPTADEPASAATATALPATEAFASVTPQLPIASATSTPEEEPTAGAPANLTLTAIREAVVARRELAAARPSPTSVEPVRAATATATKQIASVTPQLPEASATSTSVEEPAQIAPANLTLTAIREAVVARREQATARQSPTSAEPVSAATATTTDEIASVTPEPPVASATSTSEEQIADVAPANLTLTAIRETVVARREQATARPSPTSAEPVRAATATALPATEAFASVTPQPPEASATLRPLKEPAQVAPANLTLTAIRETVVARREQATTRPSPTADESVSAATALPATEAFASVTPDLPETSVTSTPVEELTAVAPANLTLTAIRETVVARRELATTLPSPTADESVSAATALPATEAMASVTPEPPIASATSTQEEEIIDVAPANLTLTAIRETVVARREQATTLPSPTSDESVRAATALPATETFASVTSTPVEEPTEVAPANLTLTAIRETVVARREQATTRPSPTADEPVRAATATALPATEAFARVTPQPPEASATSTPVEEPTAGAPANLTLTAIRETVVARREQATARPSPTAAEPASAATATALPATEAFASVTPDLPETSVTSTPVEEETSIAPANLTLTAIGEMLLATRPSPVQAPVSHLTPTSTPLPDYLIYLIPTPTAFGAIEDSFRSDCEIERDWLSYEVKEGDTLLSLALSTGSSLIELREGNCYTPVRGIFAGERLLVPRLPASPAATPAPIVVASDEAAEVIGCDRPLAQILLPAPHAQVEGVFAIIGSAQLPAGARYRLAVKPGWSEVYYPYLESDVAVGNDVLALVNTEIFGLGAHRVQLSVADSAGELIEGGICEIPIMFGSP